MSQLERKKRRTHWTVASEHFLYWINNSFNSTLIRVWRGEGDSSYIQSILTRACTRLTFPMLLNAVASSTSHRSARPHAHARCISSPSDPRKIRAMFTVAETWCRQERFFIFSCRLFCHRAQTRSLVCVLFQVVNSASRRVGNLSRLESSHRWTAFTSSLWRQLALNKPDMSNT